MRRAVYTRPTCAGEQWPQLALVGQVVEPAGANRERHARWSAPYDPLDGYGHTALVRSVRGDQPPNALGNGVAAHIQNVPDRRRAKNKFGADQVLISGVRWCVHC